MNGPWLVCDLGQQTMTVCRYSIFTFDLAYMFSKNALVQLRNYRSCSFLIILSFALIRSCRNRPDKKPLMDASRPQMQSASGPKGQYHRAVQPPSTVTRLPIM